MPRGGVRPGAGAPIGNNNAYKHGGYSGKTKSQVKLQVQSLSDEEAERLVKECLRYCESWLARTKQPIQSKTMRPTVTGRRGGQYGNSNALKTGFHTGEVLATQRTKQFFECLTIGAYLIEQKMNKGR